jgi:hypothetical protein
VFQANHGNQILVANPTGGGNFAGYRFAGKSGDRVLCRWSMADAKYFIVVIEPNDKSYHTLDVVTDVNFGAQTVTKKTIEFRVMVPLYGQRQNNSGRLDISTSRPVVHADDLASRHTEGTHLTPVAQVRWQRELMLGGP